jgi:hypothetical protein
VELRRPIVRKGQTGGGPFTSDRASSASVSRSPPIMGTDCRRRLVRELGTVREPVAVLACNVNLREELEKGVLSRFRFARALAVAGLWRVQVVRGRELADAGGCREPGCERRLDGETKFARQRRACVREPDIVQ